MAIEICKLNMSENWYVIQVSVIGYTFVGLSAW